jgi:hypothetical protein
MLTAFVGFAFLKKEDFRAVRVITGRVAVAEHWQESSYSIVADLNFSRTPEAFHFCPQF